MSVVKLLVRFLLFLQNNPSDRHHLNDGLESLLNSGQNALLRVPDVYLVYELPAFRIKKTARHQLLHGETAVYLAVLCQLERNLLQSGLQALLCSALIKLTSQLDVSVPAAQNNSRLLRVL